MSGAGAERPLSRVIGRRPKKGLSGKIQCFVSAEEKRNITEAASLLGVSASRFVARAAIRDAENVLLGACAMAAERVKDKTEAQRLSLSLTPSECRILAETRESEVRGKVTVTSIATRLAVDLAMATRLTRRLEGLELLERKRDPKDRRQLLLRLTPKGREVLETSERELRP